MHWLSSAQHGQLSSAWLSSPQHAPQSFDILLYLCGSLSPSRVLLSHFHLRAPTFAFSLLRNHFRVVHFIIFHSLGVTLTDSLSRYSLSQNHFRGITFALLTSSESPLRNHSLATVPASSHHHYPPPCNHYGIAHFRAFTSSLSEVYR